MHASKQQMFAAADLYTSLKVCGIYLFFRLATLHGSADSKRHEIYNYLYKNIKKCIPCLTEQHRHNFVSIKGRSRSNNTIRFNLYAAESDEIFH